MALTAKQARFVAEYLIDLNGKQAAIRAGYKPSNAEVQASELLALPKVSEAVAAGKAQQLQVAELKAQDVIAELRCLGFSDIGAIFDDAGQLKNVRQLPKGVRAAIASVKVLKTNVTSGDGQQEVTREIKLWDKVRALETLAKHFGLLTEKLEITGEVALVTRLQAARARLAKSR